MPPPEPSLGADAEVFTGPGTPYRQVSQHGNPGDANSCWEEK